MSQDARQQDRIEAYLKPRNVGVLFDELSDAYLRLVHMDDILRGVPVPIDAGVGEELTTLSIALGMARVIGADTNFPYTEQYLAYLRRFLGEDLLKVLRSEGAKAAGSGDYELGCIYFRAALLAEPNDRDALYLYARACKDAYEVETTDEAYVGNFKAESLEVFELLTMLYADFAMGYYFLGYAYANLGLYLKAQLTWRSYMDLTAASGDPETEALRAEIQGRLDSLEEPVRIEQGVNAVLSGDYQGGRDILLPYTDGKYAQWWPLWYYLAACEVARGDAEAAIRDYQQALVYSPSNLEVMDELASVCEAIGDHERAAKYRMKMSLVQRNRELEQEDQEA